MLKALKNHRPEYLMEPWGLGRFMISTNAVVYPALTIRPNALRVGEQLLGRMN